MQVILVAESHQILLYNFQKFSGDMLPDPLE